MIDGKPYKALRRHLAANGLTPETYRERYGLKADYRWFAPKLFEASRRSGKGVGFGAQARRAGWTLRRTKLQCPNRRPHRSPPPSRRPSGRQRPAQGRRLIKPVLLLDRLPGRERGTALSGPSPSMAHTVQNADNEGSSAFRLRAEADKLNLLLFPPRRVGRGRPLRRHSHMTERVRYP